MRTVAFLIFLFLIPAAGEACNCVPTKSIKKEFRNSSSVFIGKVVSITPVNANIDSNNISQFRVVFELKKGFKNAWKKRMQVITTTANDCGYVFEKDVEYLVYAVGGLVLETNQCTRTKEALESPVDIMVLNYLINNHEGEEEEEEKSKNMD
jgi:hypothetical protein